MCSNNPVLKCKLGSCIPDTGFRISSLTSRISEHRFPSTAFWKDKRVLVTGHTGFKGSWLSMWLHHLGAAVYGFALDPPTNPSLYEVASVANLMQSDVRCDLADYSRLRDVVASTQPEVVLHLAAQSLVRASYRKPVATLATNIMGTAHVLDALRGVDTVRVALMVTTDKVYRNLELPYPYREDDTLGGHDPYSASKAASEIVTSSYREAFLNAQGVAVASARAGNVIGGGDWSEDRLIPDAIRSWSADKALEIRNPQAIRPWQHVLEPLCGYLILAEQLWFQPELAGAYNFGPHTHEAATVKKVVEMAREFYGTGEIVYGNNTGPHEAGWLALETAKSRTTLSVWPKWNLDETVRRTIVWYQAQNTGGDPRALCMGDMADYANELRESHQ